METHANAREKRRTNTSNNPKPATVRDGEVYAALDLGTNNCRLLVASPSVTEGSLWPVLKVLDSYSRIVRLGEGIGSQKKLSEDAIDRTIKALKVCQSKLLRYPAAKVRCVATEACRRASNGADFVRRVEEEVGLHIDVINTEEEAMLAFYGCCSLLKDAATKALTFDIGGGSTEFMWASRPTPTELPSVIGWTSVPYGVMTLSEISGSSGYAEMYFEEIVNRIEAKLAEFDEEHGILDAMQQGGVQLLSTSGTVTTLAAIHLELQRYDRARIDGLTLSMQALRDSTHLLMNMSARERYAHPCVGQQRAEYIISGCAILEAIHNTWPFAEITIADRGVREGIIMKLIMNQQEQKDVAHG